MPILKNAQKALRASQRKAGYNQQAKSRLKTSLDKMSQEPNQDNLKKVFSAIDKAVKRHLVAKNKAARMKSKVSKMVDPKTAAPDPANAGTVHGKTAVSERSTTRGKKATKKTTAKTKTRTKKG